MTGPGLTKVFSPISIGAMTVKNRFAMAPMATSFCTNDSMVSPKLIDYYTARSRGEVGLIITEVTSVVKTAAYVPNQMALWDDKFIPGMKELTASVHTSGAKIVPQIVHPGGENISFISGRPSVGPSPVLSRSKGEVPQELSLEEIKKIIEQFGEAARRARAAGFDGVELHGAHAHLLVGAFMSPLRNKRFDEYGGSIEGRLKLPLDIIRNIKQKAGDDFPIIFRTSGDEAVPGGRSLQETQYIAPILVEAGVNAFHISGGVYPDQFWRIIPPMGTPLASHAPYAAAVKEVVDVPVITVGRILSPQLAEHLIQTGKADMVALGRPLLADPELPKKAREGRVEDITPCIFCGIGCIQVRQKAKPMTCLMNPFVGREGEPLPGAAAEPRKVLVIGGGPGGLTAARVAAARGHDVTLYEKTAKLGGQFRIAAVPPFKQDIAIGLKYMVDQARKAGVKIMLNTEAGPELIEQEKPDVVINAAGAVPFIPSIPGVDSKIVVTANALLDGHPDQGAENIVILGGGLAGPEIADLLADNGDNLAVKPKKVSIITTKKSLAMNLLPEARVLLMERLRDKGVKIYYQSQIKEIRDDNVVFSKDGKDITLDNIDCVVLARGVRSDETLRGAINGLVKEVHVIGDAAEPRQALEAIAEGVEVGLKL